MSNPKEGVAGNILRALARPSEEDALSFLRNISTRPDDAEYEAYIKSALESGRRIPHRLWVHLHRGMQASPHLDLEELAERLKESEPDDMYWGNFQATPYLMFSDESQGNIPFATYGGHSEEGTTAGHYLILVPESTDGKVSLRLKGQCHADIPDLSADYLYPEAKLRIGGEDARIFFQGEVMGKDGGNEQRLVFDHTIPIPDEISTRDLWMNEDPDLKIHLFYKKDTFK